MEIKLIRKKISREELKRIAQEGYEEMVKVAVDIKKEVLALGGELHADGEELLLKNGSRSQDIWGANIYLDKPKRERIEFFALINIRPTLGNRAMEIQDKKVKEKIKEIINKLLE